jgi:hypothetical protein
MVSKFGHHHDKALAESHPNYKRVNGSTSELKSVLTAIRNGG